LSQNKTKQKSNKSAAKIAKRARVLEARRLSHEVPDLPSPSAAVIMSMEDPDVDYEDDDGEQQQDQQQQPQPMFGYRVQRLDDDSSGSETSSNRSQANPPDDDNSLHGGQSLSSAGSGGNAGADDADENPSSGLVLKRHSGSGRSRKAETVKEPISDTDRDALSAEVSYLRQRLSEMEQIVIASDPSAIADVPSQGWARDRERARLSNMRTAQRTIQSSHDANHEMVIQTRKMSIRKTEERR
jgi:hypothetical protein